LATDGLTNHKNVKQVTCIYVLWPVH